MSPNGYLVYQQNPKRDSKLKAIKNHLNYKKQKIKPESVTKAYYKMLKEKRK